jgi:hypothetical protein
VRKEVSWRLLRRIASPLFQTTHSHAPLLCSTRRTMADVKEHGWFLGTQPHTHYLLLVAEQFDISRSDCTRAGGTSVVTCESDNGVL